MKKVQRVDSRFLPGFAVLALLAGSVSMVAEANSPLNMSADVPWSSGFGGVADIKAAFERGRRAEENQLGLVKNSLGPLVMPTQAVWNGLTDDAKALFLINAERSARANSSSGVIGLPLAGIEPKVDAVARAYASLLLNTSQTGHYQPSGNPDVDNPDKRITKKVGGSCKEFLARSENLAYFWTASTAPLTAKSILLPLERAIYGWIYDDAGSAWGHREALLLQDETLLQQGQGWGYKNNFSSSKHEGWLGFHVVGSSKYKNAAFASYPYQYGVVVVMNIYDPVSTSAATPCKYAPTLLTEDLQPLANKVNKVPKALNDAASTAYGKPVSIGGVLNNDSDPDGQKISVVANTAPTNGTVKRVGNAFTYTPKAGFFGKDQFKYTIQDVKGAKASATVRVTVKAP